MIPKQRKKNRIVLLPSGRGILLHRVSGGVVGFSGRTDIWGCVEPDCIRHYRTSAGHLHKIVKAFGELAVRS